MRASALRLLILGCVAALAGCGGNDEPPTGPDPDSPTITSVTPDTAFIGDAVALTGSRFANVAAANHVTFGSVETTAFGATDSTLQVLVPPGATSGPLTVTVGVHSGSSADTVIVLWTAIQPVTATPLLYDIVWNGFRFVAVGSGGTILTSTNGTTWQRATDPQYESLRAVAANNSGTVAVGNEGAIVFSQTGSSWASVPSPTDLSLAAVAAGPNGFVAVPGNGSVVLFSETGASWTGHDLDSSYTMTEAVVSDRYYALADDLYAISSADGSSWTANATNLRLPAPNGAVGTANRALISKPHALYRLSGKDMWSSATPSENLMDDFLDVAVAPGAYFLAVNAHGVISSLDGGGNWKMHSQFSEAASGSRVRVACSDSVCVAVGDFHGRVMVWRRQ
ncbi:MAG: IPT/TIG domain-containing protein [candidate division Zixibacteria bacterium]|nr:IPT/TIG domain-containing protein [candidate division Zixibacteria bacterium]